MCESGGVSLASEKRRPGYLSPKRRQERFDALFALGCIVCLRERLGYVEPEIHHLKGARWSGAGQKATDAHTIPLCPRHHRHGPDGYHHSPKEFEDQHGTQAELLEITNETLEHMEDLPW